MGAKPESKIFLSAMQSQHCWGRLRIREKSYAKLITNLAICAHPLDEVKIPCWKILGYVWFLALSRHDPK